MPFSSRVDQQIRFPLFLRALLFFIGQAPTQSVGSSSAPFRRLARSSGLDRFLNGRPQPDPEGG